MKRYFLLWFPMLIIAILNGVARDLVYLLYFNESTARQLSTLSLVILFAIYFYFVFKKYIIKSKRESFKIGLLWMTLTLVFEFSFGIYRDLTLNEILSDYNILNGRVWILIPIWLLFAPRLFYDILNRPKTK